jgi:hypothetical protein
MAPVREAGPGHAYRCRLDPLWRDAA